MSHPSWLAAMTCLERLPPGAITLTHGPAHRCPMCLRLAAADAQTGWVIEPVAHVPVCIHCACDVVAFVISPPAAEAASPRQFDRLAGMAGVDKREARLIWLLHLQSCIMKAVKSGRGLQTSDEDLLMIVELIAREKEENA